MIVDEHFRGSETVDNVIMTTWHTSDSFEEALRDFLVAATPAAAYEETCRTWLAVAVGSDPWAARLVSALRDPEVFMEPWLSEDEDQERALRRAKNASITAACPARSRSWSSSS